MTQYGYEPLSPDDSGSTLLGRVNGVVPALLTNHKGAARPGYVQPGMMWIDDSGASWLLNLYDGTSDVLIAAINPDTHALVPSFVPLTRKLKVGSGLSLDGTEGNDEEPAAFDLAADRFLRLAFATPAETAGGTLRGKPIDPAGLAVALAALGGSSTIKGGTTVELTGTSVSASGIPPGAKRVTIVFDGVSLSGSASNILIQAGSADGIEATGYRSSAGIASQGSANGYTSTIGYIVASLGGAGVTHWGHAVLEKAGVNRWVCSAHGGLDNGAGINYSFSGGGGKTLANTLDRLRITTSNGTDTFDAGTATVYWE
ncbi:MAG: hypothetical protein H6R00_4061 [Proteobacteria bacterium]|nr:hypothetical protein [Pseudomonadota bacterium]